MVIIDSSKCLGCGKCIRDCFSFAIRMSGNTAVHSGNRCMECGHCVAICPAGAVKIDSLNMDEVIEFKDMEQSIDPDVYLNHLKGRRSIRKFKEMEVQEADIRKIIEAGRYSPTGGNMQNVSYYVARKDVAELRDMVYESLRSIALKTKESGAKMTAYERMWLGMYDAYITQGKDQIFFNAKNVIVISAPAAIEAVIAAAHMETMIYSMGLGMLYSGFTTRAFAASSRLKEHIQLKDGYQVQAVLVIGHPEPVYVRTAPRKEADVIWN